MTSTNPRIRFEERDMTTTKTVLGFTFNEMTRDDWDSFAGAEPGTLICTPDYLCGSNADGRWGVLFLMPNGSIVEATWDREEGDNYREVTWTVTSGI
jgi:hypothetical protein